MVHIHILALQGISMDDIRVGIIGVGLLGNVHLMALQTIAEAGYFDGVDISIEAACDTREQHLAEYKELHGIPRAFTDYRELLQDGNVNTVFIATPTAYHKDIFVAAADAGMQVFCEKPLAFSIEDIDEMIAARDRNGTRTQVGHSLRAHPGFWHVRSLVRDPANREKFGQLQNVHFRSDQAKPYTGSGMHPSIWRQDKTLAHAGTLFEHSIHDFDMLRYWFGEITEVYAKVNYFAGIDQIEDSVSAVFELNNGATGVLSAIWHDVQRDARHIELFWERAFLSMDYSMLNVTGTLKVQGEKAVKFKQKEMDENYRQHIGFSDKPPMWVKNYGYEDLLYIAYLVDGVSRAPLVTDLEQGRRATEIVEACYRSSRQNQPVNP
ncbi:hypothetical protein GF325_04255 [Candidatus Bathyarchaeota archaeon]|nr:hypothetical protein [Candidatus Bathyarchaeota archaeon]